MCIFAMKVIYWWFRVNKEKRSDFMEEKVLVGWKSVNSLSNLNRAFVFPVIFCCITSETLGWCEQRMLWLWERVKSEHTPTKRAEESWEWHAQMYNECDSLPGTTICVYSNRSVWKPCGSVHDDDNSGTWSPSSHTFHTTKNLAVCHQSKTSPEE